MSGTEPGPSPSQGTRRAAGPPRWQIPEVDGPALALARAVQHSVDALRTAGRSRWAEVLEPLIDPLQDGDLRAVRLAANRVRAAFGVGESVAEDLSDADARVLRDATDATLRALARHDAISATRTG
jgi:hypothetical protein